MKVMITNDNLGGCLSVYHEGKTIGEYYDTMEPEDACFARDLAWVARIIEKAYALGVDDGKMIMVDKSEYDRGFYDGKMYIAGEDVV